MLSDMIELTEFQKEVCELILDTSPPGKHSARNAIENIKKAWAIKEIDPEIAVFRAITAEEEASTAIFHSLKRRNYQGANQINYRNHIHKTALSPFFWAISSLFESLEREIIFDPKLIIDIQDHNPRFKLRVTVKETEGNYCYVYPDLPLNWTIKLNDKICDFSIELNKIAERKNVSSIIDYIKETANKRNIILYASEKGIPKINHSIDAILTRKKEIVFSHLMIFLLIDPYPEHQLFVQQALNAFLKMLGKIPKDIDFF